MQFVYDDGGRSDAGFKGEVGDCVTRAIAIATGKPYKAVYDDLNQFIKKTERGGNKSSARNGVKKKTRNLYLKRLGWVWTPTMFIGSGCRVHLIKEELPSGLLIVSLSGHLTVVRDHVIYDNHDPQRPNRCVYGYWQQGESINNLPA